MVAPNLVLQLVERFENNIESYKSGKYNETQVRTEFINPFFEALGWDVRNISGYAEAYKDVVHEYTLKTTDVAKAPDYLFRVGGNKKFFVEAKRPSVNLKDDISPAFQLRRYAWSAKLPLSILTDFEELAIYDCRIQPKKNDKSSTARIKYFTYKDYIDNWNEIESIFSKEAILKGSFDKFAETNKGKKGTTQVDDAFLLEIEKWREQLAKNIALRNNTLTNRELNFSIQKIIDRIIFLRICEDRGAEDYGQLYNLLNGNFVYERLNQIFRRADEKYNSGLFHFEQEKDRSELPDEITPNLNIDDKVLKDIFKNLYYPDCPYEFSVLGADILGHVYEQFLGKVIRLTPGHRAIIEEKPEVKKAGGVYYTPTYIVDYIVKNTLGKKLEEIEQKYSLTSIHAERSRSIDPVSSHSELVSESKEANRHSEQIGKKTCHSGLDPESSHSERSEESHKLLTSKINKAIKEASTLTILDPACGSGSFLIGAYQYLLDWHLNLYTQNVEQIFNMFKKNPPIFEFTKDDYRLTTAEKKRILLNNIYGVDIDSQAVEVTKLSLLLKVLEGETDETLTTQMNMFRERALPDLSNNIKCGNSLIGPDFYAQTELELDEEEQYRINVFDWKKEFKEIFNSNSSRAESRDGFDVVIGNPPYVRIQTTLGIESKYYSSKYTTATKNYDLYCLFLEAGTLRLKQDGALGYIVPHRFFKTDYGEGIREYFNQTNLLNKIFDFDGYMVFDNASINTTIIFLGDSKTSSIDYARVTKSNMQPFEIISLLVNNEVSKRSSLIDTGIVNKSILKNDQWNFIFNHEQKLWSKIQDIKLKLINATQTIFQGIKTGADPVFIGELHKKGSKTSILNFKNKENVELENDIIFDFIKSGNIKPYTITNSTKKIIFPYVDGNLISQQNMIKKFPKTFEYLLSNKHLLIQRDRGGMNNQYWYGYSRNQALNHVYLPKLLTPDYYAHNSFAIDEFGGMFFTGGGAGGYGIIPNENVNKFFLLALLNSKLINWFIQKTSLRAYQTAFMFTKKYISIIPIVMPALNDIRIQNLSISLVRLKSNNSKTPQEKTSLQRQIDAVDNQIDQLVYELYGLTEEEIKIVEESVGN